MIGRTMDGEVGDRLTLSGKLGPDAGGVGA